MKGFLPVFIGEVIFEARLVAPKCVNTPIAKSHFQSCIARLWKKSVFAIEL